MIKTISLFLSNIILYNIFHSHFGVKIKQLKGKKIMIMMKSIFYFLLILLIYQLLKYELIVQKII